MPVVPFSSQVPEAQRAPEIDPSYLLMAAAQMHSMGRLFEPEPDDGRSEFHKSIDRRIGDAPDDITRSPLEIDKGTSSKDEMTPQRMQSQSVKPPPEAIYDDSGKIVDIDTKPRKKK